MSNPAKTVFIFGCYLIILGLTLLLCPNLLLRIFHIPPTSEVWIRVVGMLVLFLSVYYLVAASAEIRILLIWSARLRGTVIFFFGGFVLAGLAPPALILFGAVDLAGALWTWNALQKDTRIHPTRVA